MGTAQEIVVSAEEHGVTTVTLNRPGKRNAVSLAMIADFTGASAQVPFPVNSTAAVSAAGVFITVKSVFDPLAPLNQGSFRPIEVITPPGTIVNVQRPAPAGSHAAIAAPACCAALRLP